MKAEEYTCKVCHTPLPAGERYCPRCGARRGRAVPAFLRCKNCNTVVRAGRKKCPGCGQAISPQTAVGILLPPGYTHRSKMRRRWWIVAVVALIAVLAAEAYVVSGIYANITYREALHLWNSSNSNIEANRREPDPVYVEPVAPEIPDSLFDDDDAPVATPHIDDVLADTVLRD